MQLWGGGVTEQEKAVRGTVGLLVLLQLFLDLPVGLLAHLIVLVGLAGAEAAHATGRASATTQRARAPPRHRPNDESPPVTDGRRQPVRRPYERRIRDRRSSPAATAAAATTIRRRRRRPAYRAGRASSISTTTANACERGG